MVAERLEFESIFTEPSLGLRADQRALRQMLINLLSNAVKFTPEGGHVKVTAGRDDEGRFVISVSDTGIGISEEDQPKVLLPFNQVDSRLSRKYEGTGLGLPLTKRLMELHGGWLEIESALERGTKVSLIFPRERVIATESKRDDDARHHPMIAEPLSIARNRRATGE